MDSYLWLKLLHVLSATVLTGTGVGIAFFMFCANRSNNVQVIYVTAKHVVLADWLFTAPAVVTQLVTGLLLMNQLGYSFSSTWFIWVTSLFVFIGVCWLPVIVIQYRLRALAKASLDSGSSLDGFKRLMNLWTMLGIPAFISILIMFWLMVFKPVAVI